ncbi:MbtH family NRPS accessory protein [Streptomyces sioyaensis]|uniref:MbtH family NRPS accessory protein n=1 Tax=Streptomyces sioyaensis TaxID=67364 RepID=UPI00379631A0
MTGNPFDADGDGGWAVVVNALGQHALWRTFLDLPTGWRAVVGDAERETALDYVEQHWIGGPGPVEPARSASGTRSTGP